MFRSEWENKSFLVIDDFSDMRLMIKGMLISLGMHDIIMCRDGPDALKAMQNKKFDVVLCDYNLGKGQDGQQILEEARQRKLISLSTIFCMVTAENTQGMVLGAIEYQPDSYLSKPFNKDMLEKRLEIVLVKKDNLKDIDFSVTEKEYSKAIHLIDEQILNKSKNTPDLIRLKAEVHLKAGDYSEAESIYLSALKKRALNWASLGLGQVYIKQQKLPEAKAIFKELIDEHEDLTAAYDLLAKVYKMEGDLDASQETLSKAIEISPKAILRQQVLAEVAMENNDYNVADKAFTQAISLGQHSIYRSPRSYSGLATTKVLNEDNKDKKAAFKVLEQLKRVYKDDKTALMHAELSKITIHNELGEKDEANKSLEEAEKLFNETDAQSDSGLSIFMAQANAELGFVDKANTLFKQAVQNNHDDDELIRKIESIAKNHGMEKDIDKIVNTVRKEIVGLNNRAIKMAKKGDTEAAAKIFEEAADKMQGNVTINANAAKAFLVLLEKNGPDNKRLKTILEYIDRVESLDADQPDLPMLKQRLKNL